MTRTEPQVRDRTVEVSPEALSRICPESHLASSRPVGSLATRLGACLRVRMRLLGMRLRFRMGDLRGPRCLLVSWRLRARLAWMRLRMRRRGRLP